MSVSDYLSFVLKRDGICQESSLFPLHSGLLSEQPRPIWCPSLHQNLISPFLCDVQRCRNRMRSYLTPPCGLRGFVICTLRCDLGSNHS